VLNKDNITATTNEETASTNHVNEAKSDENNNIKNEPLEQKAKQEDKTISIRSRLNFSLGNYRNLKSI